jgi:hypothetical protein
VKQLELEIASEACNADWIGMPAYDHADLSPKRSIVVNFRNQDDVDRFAALIQQDISGTKKSIWYPRVKIERYANKRYVSDRPLTPKYPIYIVSKGRWEKPLTAMQLEAFGVPYRIVVEPQEYEHYSKVIDPARILKLPFSNLGQGSTPARNWIWEHAIGTGAKRHWILDDNLYMFLRFHGAQALAEPGVVVVTARVQRQVAGMFVAEERGSHELKGGSAAPMPYMQRITWSGIALHAGVLPGHPASHGCIRLAKDFAIRLWHLTKRGTRVIIAPNNVDPVQIASPRVFSKPKTASSSQESSRSTTWPSPLFALDQRAAAIRVLLPAP